MIPAADLTLAEGVVPAAIDAPHTATRYWQMSRDEFRLAIPSGLTFYYRRGVGTTFARGPDVSDTEVALFFEGSVRGAIAWLGGLVPLHASAVIAGGVVHAFTGVSGAGKSTLVAALTRYGLPLFCDDVLIVHPGGAGAPCALPGHKRLKLCGDALALTGHQPIARVQPAVDKYYVKGARIDTGPLPLARLYLLEAADGDPAIIPVAGAARILALRDAFYRPHYGAAVLDPAERFCIASALADRIDVRRFVRTRDKARFAVGVALLADELSSLSRKDAA